LSAREIEKLAHSVKRFGLGNLAAADIIGC